MIPRRLAQLFPMNDQAFGPSRANIVATTDDTIRCARMTQTCVQLPPNSVSNNNWRTTNTAYYTEQVQEARDYISLVMFQPYVVQAPTRQTLPSAKGREVFKLLSHLSHTLPKLFMTS
jgi:hypothetical protein